MSASRVCKRCSLFQSGQKRTIDWTKREIELRSNGGSRLQLSRDCLRREFCLCIYVPQLHASFGLCTRSASDCVHLTSSFSKPVQMVMLMFALFKINLNQLSLLYALCTLLSPFLLLGELPVLAKTDAYVLVDLHHLLHRCTPVHLHLSVYLYSGLLAKWHWIESSTVSLSPFSICCIGF